jgi:hypothetical protein
VKPLRVRVPVNPKDDPAGFASWVNTVLVGGTVYGQTVRGALADFLGGLDLGEFGVDHIQQAVQRMAPRDPLEEALVVQFVLSHARVMKLSAYLASETDLLKLTAAQELCDRASNTCRRLMLALAEYRKQSRPGVPAVQIGSANIAERQVVVQSVSPPAGKLTNEQGCPPDFGDLFAEIHDASTPVRTQPRRA